jgi:hypothetical protein
LRKWGPLGLPYDSEHGKLWQDIKADLDKTRARASKFAATVEWAFGKKTARVLGVLALFAVVVALLFLFLDLYVAPTKPSEKKDLVLAVAQILAGTALLSGLYFTWRTLQVNREGQITERFTRAIEQLGATHDDKSKNLELRLGDLRPRTDRQGVRRRSLVHHGGPDRLRPATRSLATRRDPAG